MFHRGTLSGQLARFPRLNGALFAYSSIPRFAGAALAVCSLRAVSGKNPPGGLPCAGDPGGSVKRP